MNVFREIIRIGYEEEKVGQSCGEVVKKVEEKIWAEREECMEER